MGVDAVLQSTAPVDKGGVLTRTRRGQLCYDMAALTRDVKQRSAALMLEHALLFWPRNQSLESWPALD